MTHLTERQRVQFGPRDQKVKGSPEWCLQTVEYLKNLWKKKEHEAQLVAEVIDEIKAVRVWEIVPPEAPYGSLEALLKAELGSGTAVVQDEVSRLLEVDRLDQMNPSRQGERTDLVNIVNEVQRPQGNSTAQALRRLRKDRKDLHARVLAGELTPHAAMIEAGFRKKWVQLPPDVPGAVQALRRHFDESQIKEIVRKLQWEKEPC
jgi:hypothetical protein